MKEVRLSPQDTVQQLHERAAKTFGKPHGVKLLEGTELLIDHAAILDKCGIKDGTLLTAVANATD